MKKNTCFRFIFNSNYPFSTHKNHTLLCCFLRYKNKELRNSYYILLLRPLLLPPSSSQIHYNIYSSFLLVFIIFQITPAPVFFCPHRKKERKSPLLLLTLYILLFCDSYNSYMKKKRNTLHSRHISLTFKQNKLKCTRHRHQFSTCIRPLQFCNLERTSKNKQKIVNVLC